MVALRLKIQNEARQLMQNHQVDNTQIVRIVERDARKEHGQLKGWDYIRLNEWRPVDLLKSKVTKAPSIRAIVKA